MNKSKTQLNALLNSLANWWAEFDFVGLMEKVFWIVLGFIALVIFLRFLKRRIHYFILRRKGYGFQRVAGMDDIKQRIYTDVIFPFYHAKQYKKFNLSLPNGILLYGPPGCGKTFFIERLAEELGMNYIRVSHSDLASPYIHETVAKISEMFEAAKANAPCLLFIDELEGIVPSRDDMGGNALYKHEEVNEFLLHLNNASANGVLVIGATNYLEQIDAAVLRSGRFDLKIYIAPPDDKAREALFLSELKRIPHEKDIDISALVALTDNYASSDIVSIVKQAARETIAQGLKRVNQALLIAAIQNTPSSLQSDE